MGELLIAIALFCQTPNGRDSSSALEDTRAKQVACQKQLVKCAADARGFGAQADGVMKCISSGEYK